LIVYHLSDWQHLHSTVGIRFTIISLAFTLLVLSCVALVVALLSVVSLFTSVKLVTYPLCELEIIIY
jgi:hypothetical protein